MDEYDYYYRDILDGASDVDSNQSSDDDDTDDYKRLFEHGKHLSKEDKEILWGSAEVADHQEDSNLSFEREMENEARQHINGVHVNAPPSATPPQQSASTVGARTSLAASSGSSRVPFAPVAVASTSKTREQQNDELFYDPDEDERDQAWADAQRARHSASKVPSKLPVTERQKRLAESLRLKKAESDATLNCPCCLTLLCLDCQRHDIYKTQYRAMFVLNCRIDFDKRLLHRDKEQQKKQFRRSKKHKVEQSGTSAALNGQAEKPAESDLYYPVHCCTCNTQVALYDIDQVYHFFSVLASH